MFWFRSGVAWTWASNYSWLGCHERCSAESIFWYVHLHPATHCNTLQRTSKYCNALQHTSKHCNTLRHTVTHCNTLQHKKILWNLTKCQWCIHVCGVGRVWSIPSRHAQWRKLEYCKIVQDTSTCHMLKWNTLQRTATHCNTLQHTATYCNTLQHTATHSNKLQHTTTQCNTLQHITPYTLQHTQSTATHCTTKTRWDKKI